MCASCFSKIQIGFTFLVPAHLGSPGKRAVKRVCVCVSASDVRYFLAVWHIARAARRILCSIVLILVVGDDSLLTLMVYNATTVPPRLNITIHTHYLTAFFPGLPGWAGTRKVKQIWILLKQETVSGSGISWAICKSAPRSRQITMPAPHHSVFLPLPAAHPTASKH